MPLESEEILVVGFEGESLCLFRQRVSDGTWAYGIRVDSSTLLDMMDDDEAEKVRADQKARTPVLYPSFEVLIQHVSPDYVRGVPIRVHPEFRNDIWAAYCRTLKELPNERASVERSERWQRACCGEDQMDAK